MKYYAKYCSWGANAVNSQGKYWADYYAFDTKQKRDSWVEKHECKLNGCTVVAAAVTRREVEQQFGKNFTITKPDCSADFNDVDYRVYDRYGKY